MNATCLTNHPIDFYTALQLVGFREGFEVDTKTMVSILSCCKLFNEFSCISELQNDYWKGQVSHFFSSVLHDDQTKTDRVWKDIFYRCSNDFVKIIDSNHKDIISQNYKHDLLPLIKLYIGNLSLINATCSPILRAFLFYHLYVSYEKGLGVDKDSKEAFKFCKLSADQGLDIAQFYVGWAFDRGIGVDVNIEESMKYMGLSAKRGFPAAQIMLAQSYEHGYGLDQNIGEAIKYYNLAADQDRWLDHKTSANEELERLKNSNLYNEFF